LRAGKHVFCEKPMALAVKDCKRMVAAAERADRQLLIGHVLPFVPEYAWACKVIASGKYGALRGGSFRRVISDPAWLRHYWNADVVGGPMLDLHIHDAHLIRMLFGMPVSVSTAGRMRGDLAEFWTTQFQYDNNVAVTATSGTIDQQGRPFGHGFEIHLDRATLVFEFAVMGKEGKYLCEPTILDDRGGARQVSLSDGDSMISFETELKQVVRAIRTGEGSPILGCELARDAVLLCQRQTESLRKGRPVRI